MNKKFLVISDIFLLFHLSCYYFRIILPYNTLDIILNICIKNSPGIFISFKFNMTNLWNI